jgi:hypothetical protein
LRCLGPSLTCFALVALACSPDPPAPKPQRTTAPVTGVVSADDIPVAHTRTDGLRPDGGPPPGTPMWRYRLRVLWDLLTSKLRA